MKIEIAETLQRTAEADFGFVTDLSIVPAGLGGWERLPWVKTHG